ncbi:AMP-binding protein [Streptomyces sp. MST-110588]|uniref:AMP-binding protein n=1 Tax=Streptomyces sp. MST-110588 TaxID=2833628 RepID=UPI001F5C6436|nr:AMP-binding protein [Streptomyces sp. MST-110588]UNO40783.1 AMP-binding protein [Streptomyces sp. MST-110588]
MTSILRGPALGEDDRRRIDQLLDHWAATTPDAPAVRHDGTVTDYRELVHGATRVAAGLSAAGVRPGDVVVVRMPRGPELYQALLAVLKCGAVYAAPEPSWPAARCAQLAAYTGARWSVGGGDGRGAVAGGGPGAEPDGPVAGTRPLDFEALRSCEAEFHPFDGDFETPACVFFTSGSSGTPKAALVRHRSVLRVARDPLLGFGRAGSALRMLQAAPSPWDAFAMELWSPLVHGGTVVVHRPGGHGHVQPHDVRAAVASGVSHLFLTTALFGVVAETDPGAFAGLDVLMTGGERACARHFARVRAAVPGVRVLHVYGPVESCVYTNAYEVPATGIPEDVPVGRPLADTTVYVLGPDRGVLDEGETGEIAVAGEGLALRYAGAPELTARAFPVLEPEPGGGPVRVYLTGDIGRIDPADGLVMLGRRDRQVKIRGMRVEPAEVEAAVTALPEVRRAAVVALPHGAPVKTHLAACVVPAGPVGPGLAAAVKEAVRRALPSAFVPDFVVAVADLPLNANGKVDAAALAALVAQHRAAGAAERAGAARVQALPEAVREVMSLVTGLLDAPVGPDEDIFASGGTSITAIRIAHWLTERTGGAVTAAQVMASQTPRAIAALLDGPAAGKAAEHPAEHPAVLPAALSSEPSGHRWLAGLPVPQWRFWYLAVTNPGSGDAHCPLEFHLDGAVDGPVLAAALRAVTGRHEALRTLLHREGRRGVRTEVLAADDVPDVLRLRTASDAQEAERTVADLLAEPFDLARQIPVRAVLVSLSPTRHTLALNIHHTAFDGWSADLLCRDLSDAYRAIASGRPLPWTAPTRYAESWLRQDLAESAADRAGLTEWGHALLGVPDLPVAGKGELAPYAPVQELDVELPAPLYAAAEAVAAGRGGTAQAVLLAAWARALRRHTGSQDLAIGIPVAGRTLPESEQVVGCFANAVACRFPGGPGQRPETDLAAAQRELGLALRFQFMPTELVLRSEVPRDRTRNPFCQAGFVVQNNRAAVLDLPGVRAAERRRARTRSSFEITLELTPGRAAPTARLWYRTDVLTERSARELAGLWRAELSALTSPAGEPAGEPPADDRFLKPSLPGGTTLAT